MEISIMLAKIFGPTFILIGLGTVFNQKYYSKMVENLKKEPVLLYMAGLISFVVGLVIALNHSIWTSDWRLAITVLGWGMLLKGVLLILAPKYAIALAHVHTKDKLFLWAALLIVLLGVALSHIAYTDYVYTLPA